MERAFPRYFKYISVFSPSSDCIGWLGTIIIPVLQTVRLKYGVKAARLERGRCREWHPAAQLLIVPGGQPCLCPASGSTVWLMDTPHVWSSRQVSLCHLSLQDKKGLPPECSTVHWLKDRFCQLNLFIHTTSLKSGALSMIFIKPPLKEYK